MLQTSHGMQLYRTVCRTAHAGQSNYRFNSLWLHKSSKNKSYYELQVHNRAIGVDSFIFLQSIQWLLNASRVFGQACLYAECESTVESGQEEKKTKRRKSNLKDKKDKKEMSAFILGPLLPFCPSLKSFKCCETCEGDLIRFTGN